MPGTDQSGEKRPCCQQNERQEIETIYPAVHAIPPEYWKLDACREHSGDMQWNQQYTPHPQGGKPLNAGDRRSGKIINTRNLLQELAE